MLTSAWLPTLAAARYGPARGCDEALNAWCEANCPHAPAHSPLFARLDTNQHGGPLTWRCYAKSTLTDDLMRFKSGDTYCTRPQQLGIQMLACLNERPPQVAQRASAPPQPARAASHYPPQPSPPASGHAGCKDALSECAVWAAYDECRQNPEYMNERCAASCNTCRTGPPQKGAPPPPPPPPQQQQTTTTATEAKEEPPPRPVAYCASPCDAAAPAGSGGKCSGRGSCAQWRGYDFCVCAHTNETKHLGPRCEQAVRADAPCSEECAAHGRCVHGFCECDFGWSGRDCATAGAMPPFLTRAALHASGLTAADDASPPGGSCPATPSLHLAYARESDRLRRLLASVPATAETRRLRCATCAVVSNAGILARREYGAEIDAHECVWRMNRAPTAGFEKQVGSRTTLDFVNSFPHLRNRNILPRLDTQLVHGMTIELWEASVAKDGAPWAGFEKYMGWVDGHVKFAETHPSHTVDVMDLAWMDRSWQAYWAYLAPFEPTHSAGRPSSGWHVARLALETCAKVTMYGFSMEADDFHYFDSPVQERVSPQQRDPAFGYTHKFAREHEVFANWSRDLPPGRFELRQ